MSTVLRIVEGPYSYQAGLANYGAPAPLGYYIEGSGDWRGSHIDPFSGKGMTISSNAANLTIATSGTLTASTLQLQLQPSVTVFDALLWAMSFVIGMLLARGGMALGRTFRFRKGIGLLLRQRDSLRRQQEIIKSQEAEINDLRTRRGPMR